MEDVAKGAVRRVAWDAVHPEDRARLMDAWLLRGPEVPPVEGLEVEHRIEPGVTLPVRGLLEEETATHVRLRLFGGLVTVERDALGARKAVELDAREVFAPDALVDRYVALLEKRHGKARLAARPHRVAMRVGEYALRVGAVTRAARELESALVEATFAERAAAARGLAEAGLRAGEETLVARLRAARREAALGAFRVARARVLSVREVDKDAQGPLRRELDAAAEALSRLRERWLRGAVARELPERVEPAIRARVASADPTFADAVAWARRELPETLYLAVAAALQPRDTVTVEDVWTAWRDRRRGALRTAGYGAGTWIAVPLPLPPARQRRLGPRPETRDRWWAEADEDTRVAWLHAYFVEHSGLFEVRAEPLACARCDGGRRETASCPRCHGALFDKVLRYR